MLRSAFYLTSQWVKDTTLNKTTATNKLKTKTGPGWRNPQGFYDKANNGVLQKGDKH